MSDEQADEEFTDESCEELGVSHSWSDWEINHFFGLREDRFCGNCGSMETQSVGQEQP